MNLKAKGDHYAHLRLTSCITQALESDPVTPVSLMWGGPVCPELCGIPDIWLEPKLEAGLHPPFSCSPFQHCFSEGQFLSLPTLIICRPSKAPSVSCGQGRAAASSSWFAFFAMCSRLEEGLRSDEGQTNTAPRNTKIA